jgi:hypothetical protein
MTVLEVLDTGPMLGINIPLQQKNLPILVERVYKSSECSLVIVIYA